MSATLNPPTLERQNPAKAEPADPWAGGPDSCPRNTARRSFELIALGWLFGSVWSTATAGSPTTIFLKELGASPFQFGVLAALPFIASLLSLPARLLTERTGERKKIILYGLFWQGG